MQPGDYERVEQELQKQLMHGRVQQQQHRQHELQVRRALEHQDLHFPR